MSVQQSPSAREVQEFQFKLLARLRLFGEDQQLPLKQSLSLVATSSKFGLIFAASENGFSVVQTSKIIELCEGTKKPSADITEFPRRSFTLGTQPSHLDVSCDGQFLAVGFTLAGSSIIRVYDVTSFTALSEKTVIEVRLSSSPVALSWNPGISNLLAACLQDGSAAVYEFKGNSFDISSIPVEAQATCLCWSPKGKQIVIGSRNGTLNQFKPDLKIVKAIPPPQGDLMLASVQWLSNTQYAVAYCNGQSSGANLMLINTPRNQPVAYVNYDDITYSNGENRLVQFYFIHQQNWNMLFVGSANSMEVGVLGSVMRGSEWEQWQLEDSSRAELPLSASHQETRPVGMALDTSVQYNLPWGDNQQLPPMPLLLLLSHEGLLTLYWTLNLIPGAANVCTAPTPLPDTTGLHLFVVPQTSGNQTSALKDVHTSEAPVTQIQGPVTNPPSSSAAPAQWQAPAPATTQPNWGHTLSTPKSEVQQGSWLSQSVSPPTFMSSLTQSAFNASSTVPSVVSAFNTSSTVPSVVSAFNTSSTVPSVVSAFSVANSTFAPLQPTGVSGPPPATPVTTSPTSTPALSVDSVQVSQEAPEPVPSPVSEPITPEPEANEESQELKALNETLIEDAMKQEIELFSWELEQLNQKIEGININVISNQTLDKITTDIAYLTTFMKDLKETTDAQEYEISSLKNFLIEAFTYVESMKKRVYLQNNPDYSIIQCPQGLDPIQRRKMAEMKSTLQYIKTQLDRVNKELADKWNSFQVSNKELREAMQIPSLETIYQAMVMHNNVMMRQKNLLDELEAKFRTCSRKQLLKMLNVSHKIDESLSNVKDTELSKMAEDFLFLNLSRMKESSTLEEIQNSMATLDVSKMKESELSSDKVTLIKDVFSDENIKYLALNQDPMFSIRPQQMSVLPITTSSVRSGSISSGQPVIQTSSVNKNDVVKENNINVLNTGTIDIQSPAKHENMKIPFSAPASTAHNTISKDKTTTNQAFPSIVSSIDCNISKNIQVAPQNNQILKTPVVSTISVTSTFSSTPTSLNNKGSFVSLAQSQASPFSSSFSFSPTATSPQVVISSSTQAAAGSVTKSINFTTDTVVATTSITTPPLTFISNKTEPSNITLSVSTPSKVISGESSLKANVTPLDSLSSLVSGIEPLDSFNTKSGAPTKSPVTTNFTTNVTKQPFVFKFPGSEEKEQPSLFKNPVISEKKVVDEKVTNVSSQGAIFGFIAENQQESNVVGNNSEAEKNNSPAEGNTIFSSSFKNFGFGSGSPKPSTPIKTEATSTSSNAETTSSEPISKNLFTFQNASSNLFGSSSVATFSPGSQKSLFGGNAISCAASVFHGQQEKPAEVAKVGTSVPQSVSPVIEISLSSSKSEGDTKTSLEKLSLAKGITITKVEPSVSESPSKPEQSENISTVSSSLIGSLNFGSFTTPTKLSESINSSSPNSKSPIMYEVSQSENQSSKEEVSEGKSNKATEEQELSKPVSLFGGTSISTATPPASFSFALPMQKDPKTPEKPQSTGFPFENKFPSTTTVTATTIVSSSVQTTSSFSFAQAPSTQPSTTTFSFAMTTTAPAKDSNTFGFGNLSTGFSDNKSKPDFSFGQQSPQTTATSASTIFGGGFVAKSSETSSIFGGSTTTETKSVFGQPATTTSNSQNQFSFSLPSATTTQSTFFGTPATTSAASFFGQPICSPTSTASSPFGQPNNVQPVFGSSTSSPFGSTSTFGSKPTFGQTGSSFFGQTSTFGASSGTVFGGSSNSVFGGSTPQSASPFGQPSGNNGIFGGGSFSSTGGQAVGQTGFGSSTFQTKPAFGSTATPAFGASPAFGGAPTFGGSPTFGSPQKVFGSPTSSPTVFGGGVQQQSSTFENLASQNTMSFGNLAQNPSPGFGSVFSSPQNTSAPPAFSSPSNSNSGSSFGGSSFSSWR